MPQTENTRELIRQSILRLKQKKQELNLTNQQIFDMVLARGLSTSESSIKRVFADGSEDICNFNYNLTIKPLNIALLDIPDSALAIPDEATPEEKDLVALRNTVRLREILDDELVESNRRLREENARLLQQLQAQEQNQTGRVAEVRQEGHDKLKNLQEQLKGERSRRRGITAVAIILGVLLFACAFLLIAYLMEDHGNPAGGIFWREAASFFFGGDSSALIGADGIRFRM